MRLRWRPIKAWKYAVAVSLVSLLIAALTGNWFIAVLGPINGLSYWGYAIWECRRG